MAHWIDVSMLGAIVDDGSNTPASGMVCPDNGTGEEIDRGWGCYRVIEPLSPEAQKIWEEVEAALNQKLLADYPDPDDCDLGMGWNNSFQS